MPCGSCQARALGICGVVSHSSLYRLAALANIVNILPGQTFIQEGAAADHFHILIAGSAKLYKLLQDGRRQIIGFEFSGSLLGLTFAKDYAFTAEAIAPVRLCRVSRRRLPSLMSDCREIEQRLLEIAAFDLISAQEQILLLGQKTAMERVASFLLFLRTRPQPVNVRPPRLHLPMSRKDIADYLGMAVETISRALAKLRDQGAIAIPNAHELVFLELPLLEAIAHGVSHPHAYHTKRRDAPVRGLNVLPSFAASEPLAIQGPTQITAASFGPIDGVS